MDNNILHKNGNILLRVREIINKVPEIRHAVNALEAGGWRIQEKDDLDVGGTFSCEERSILLKTDAPLIKKLAMIPHEFYHICNVLRKSQLLGLLQGKDVWTEEALQEELEAYQIEVRNYNLLKKYLPTSHLVDNYYQRISENPVGYICYQIPIFGGRNYVDYYDQEWEKHKREMCIAGIWHVPKIHVEKFISKHPQEYEQYSKMLVAV